MKDIHKHSFEEKFRKAFEEAEATPEPTVWAEIDAHLANQEASVYKRKLYYFKIRVAAAAVLLFGFLGGWYFMSENPASQQPIAQVQSSGSSNATQSEEMSQNAAANPSEALAKIEKQQPSTAETETTIAAEETSNERTLAKDNLPDAGAKGNLSAGKNQIDKTSDNIRLADVSENRQHQREKGLPGSKAVKERPVFPHENNSNPNATVKESGDLQNFISRNGGVKTSPDLIIKSASKRTETGAILHPQNEVIAFGTGNSINRLNTKIHINDMPLIVEAPVIKPQIDNTFNIFEEEEEEIKALSKWSVNLAFMPNQFDPNIQVDQNVVASAYNPYYSMNKSFASPSNLSPGLANADMISAPAGSDLENAQTVGISYNIGVSVNYALSDRFSIQSGLQYMRNNSQVITSNYLEDFDNRARYPAFLSLVSNNGTTGLASADSPALQNGNFGRTTNAYAGVTEVAVYNTYQYMSIPVRLQYKLIDKKLNTSIGAGIAADVFLNNTIGNKNANINAINLNSDASIYRSVGLSGIFSTKLDYALSSRYSVFLEPSYRTAITSFTKSYAVKSLPSAFGIGTGFQFRF